MSKPHIRFTYGQEEDPEVYILIFSFVQLNQYIKVHWIWLTFMKHLLSQTITKSALMTLSLKAKSKI